jgi:hypothetical protein
LGAYLTAESGGKEEVTMRSLYDVVDLVQILDPIVAKADKTSAAVDTKNYDSVRLVVNLGASGDTLSGSVYLELEVEESDDNSSWSDVADEHLSDYVNGTNDGTFALIDAAAEDEQLYDVEYRGYKRYIRVIVNLTGTHSSGIPVGAVALCGLKKVA